MVIAVSKQPTIRRNFEDAFVAQLKAAGVDAVPSYQYVPNEGQVEEVRLNRAVLAAGADAATITRLVRKEQKTNITPGYYQSFAAAVKRRILAQAINGFCVQCGYHIAWIVIGSRELASEIKRR